MIEIVIFKNCGKATCWLFLHLEPWSISAITYSLLMFLSYKSISINRFFCILNQSSPKIACHVVAILWQNFDQMTKNIRLIKIHHGHSFNFEFMNDFHYKKSMLHRSTGCKFPCHPLIVFSVESSRPTTMVFNILHTPYHPSTHTT